MPDRLPDETIARWSLLLTCIGVPPDVIEQFRSALIDREDLTTGEGGP